MVAQEAIETIHREISKSAGRVAQLSSWWYNVLYLYTSATVLVSVGKWPRNPFFCPSSPNQVYGSAQQVLIQVRSVGDFDHSSPHVCTNHV